MTEEVLLKACRQGITMAWLRLGLAPKCSWDWGPRFPSTWSSVPIQRPSAGLEISPYETCHTAFGARWIRKTAQRPKAKLTNFKSWVAGNRKLENWDIGSYVRIVCRFSGDTPGTTEKQHVTVVVPEFESAQSVTGIPEWFRKFHTA